MNINELAEKQQKLINLLIDEIDKGCFNFYNEENKEELKKLKNHFESIYEEIKKSS